MAVTVWNIRVSAYLNEGILGNTAPTDREGGRGGSSLIPFRNQEASQSGMKNLDESGAFNRAKLVQHVI